ncbi:MAG: bifunctional adenosylcobinamide kinase/adenosylcobinamide-phosphate guanylyltransferase [Deltaproteobacteria bacterium]|nr:bifunctional adenosylcobinamide kinase/adenosylcobinamide-phosphate guanylyltransferase [Deltaproteobacteria bacterium]
MNAAVILVTGGARSGKSTRALEIARSYPRRVMIAAAVPFDDEMTRRIEAHQSERGEEWVTIEEPLDLARAIKGIPSSSSAEATLVVVDCLTVWLGNLFHEEPDNVGARIDSLVAAVASCPHDLVIVTNEIGWGVVPADDGTRQFRDVAGRLNQRIARIATRVELVVSGIPVTIKGN